MNIYDYLNKRDILKKMSDNEFETFLPGFCNALKDYGFQQLLTDYNNKLTDINKNWNNLKKTKIDKNSISSTSIVGMNIIKQTMPHIYDVKNYKGKCISGLWNYANIEKVVRVNRKTHSTPYVSEIIRQLGFVAGTSKVTIYRPLLTKRIVQYFNAKQILDVCTGWGGRMLGSVSVDDVCYTGIEPYTKTYIGLKKIKKKLNFTDSQVTLYKDTAENVLPTLDRKYDLALTSPPYYNLELYTDEANQSHHYGTYETWVKKFLRPVVEGVLNKLLEGGKSCWSVKNFKTDGKYNLYDDVVQIHHENGWKQMDVEFYIGNCLRPGLKDSDGKARKSKEITYVFSRGSD
jgi:16S rRNA G966 N2-methylase RsmD